MIESYHDESLCDISSSPEGSDASLACAMPMMQRSRGPRALPDGQWRIAVIEDSRFQLAHICSILETIDNCSIEPFQSIDADVLELIEESIHGVVIDYMLPAPVGIEFVRQIRSRSALATIPIVMLTSSTESALCWEAIRAGVTDFQIKPVNPSSLRRQVKNLLKHYSSICQQGGGKLKGSYHYARP